MPSPKSNYSPRDLTRMCEGKLAIDFRDGDERTGWYYLDGKPLFRVTIPKIHRGDWGRRVQKHVFVQTRLTPDDYDDLVRCPMSASEFVVRVRELFFESD